MSKKKKKKILPSFLTCMKIFLHTCESSASPDVQGTHSPVDAGYCQGWELPGRWRVMERYERQTKEPWQAENYS